MAGKRLAVFYDGNASAKMPVGVKSHMDRDVGLAWLDLPLIPPAELADEPAASPKITVASYYFGNCWNEWTAGSCLEPDMVDGLRYLDVVREIVAERKQPGRYRQLTLQPPLPNTPPMRANHRRWIRRWRNYP